MSSPTLSRILRTTVFQRVLYAAGAFVLLMLIAILGIGNYIIWQIDRDTGTAIEDAISEAEEIYYGEGEDELIRHFAWDDGPLWDEDAIYAVIEEGWDLVVLRDEAFEPIAGYHGIYADAELGPAALDHPEIGEPLRGRMVTLRGGQIMTVARFDPALRGEVTGMMAVGTFALILVALPLSLITGYFLARAVVGRIDAVSSTAEAVAAGDLSARAELTGAEDEFDRLSGQLNGMLDRVEALTRNIEAVSIGVAHDLRTPLGNIGGRLELIRRDLAKPEALAEHVTKAEGHLDRLLRTFDALLRLGEIEAGRRKAGFSEVSLSDVVADMTEAYAPLFEDADKVFTVATIDPARIDGDAALIQQLISNLLENALEHTRDAARVEVGLSVKDRTATLRISDDGPGIPPAARERIFERFFRADASRTTPGNGLGLSLAKGIAELHGATISLTDGEPGAVFEVAFPLA